MTQPEGEAAAPRRTLFLEDEALGAASVERGEAAAEQPEQPEQVDPADEFTRRERINPWLVGLWVAAAMLVIAGIGGQIYLETTTVPMIGAGYVEVLTAEGLAVVPAVVGALAPWLVCIGLASAVSATAIHSLHWYRTHAS